MLRKTLVTLTAVAALGLGSAAMAAHGGGGGGHGGEGGGGFGGGAGFGRSGGFGGAGVAAPSGSAAPMMMRGGSVGPMTRGGMMATAPIAGGRVQGFSGRTFSRNNFAFHDRFRHRFHRRNLFAFGFFGGPFYDYASSCWSWLPTRLGWRWVYVCGGYY